MGDGWLWVGYLRWCQPHTRAQVGESDWANMEPTENPISAPFFPPIYNSDMLTGSKVNLFGNWSSGGKNV